jgi:hypothetical protein
MRCVTPSVLCQAPDFLCLSAVCPVGQVYMAMRKSPRVAKSVSPRMAN